MADDGQPPPLFADDDVKDNDEDLFEASAAVCDISGLLIVAVESRSGRGRLLFMLCASCQSAQFRNRARAVSKFRT